MSTILHVNHDDSTQDYIQNLLGQQYNVISASDGPTAIQYCAMIQPDLILMDLDLPDIDGLELTLRLKMFMPQTPILNLVSKSNANGDIPAAIPGSDGLFIKPVDIHLLRRNIRLLLPEPAEIPFAATTQTLDGTVVNKFEAQIDTLNQANNRLASLNTISALIGTSLDLEHLTDQILGQIDKTIDFDSATLFLLKGNILEAAASRGLSDHRQGMNNYSRSQQNSAWRVVDNKLPLVINDVTESDFWEGRPELSQVRAWLGVPLVYKDRVVGVLTLDKNEVGGFSDADARYVFTLAYQIAIAVENTQLFEEWENQATRLKLINEVAQEITTILDADNLFDALAWAIFERLHYDRVAILEIDSSRSFLTLRAYYGEFLPQLDVVDVYRQSIDNGLIGKSIKTGQPILINNISQDDISFLYKGTSVQSELVVPIFVGNEVEAVVDVCSDALDGFGDQDLWTLSSLGSQAATVVENARLYHDIDAYSDKLERIVDARTQRLQAITKMSQVVSQGLEVDELQAIAGYGIGQIFSSNGSGDNADVTIGLVDGSLLVVRMIYHASPEDEQSDDLSPPNNSSERVYRIDHNAPVGEVIYQARPMRLNNYHVQDIYNSVSEIDSKPTNSLLLAPLITAGKTIGMIVVESRTPDAFDESDLETLETLAFQVASAIEHVRLLRKTRELAIVDERTRLARDMHDGVAQNLAYLLIQVDRCLNMVDEESKLGQQLDQVSVLLTKNIEEIRRNIFDLRPVDLEGKSLFEVLENFVAEFGRRWNLKTTCFISGNVEDVPAEVESSLYRIVQETLSNARKHARCTEISVKLSDSGGQWLTLEVMDNGRGFDVTQLQRNPRRDLGGGLGLISMRERVERVGGQLTVESCQGQGTEIFAKLPLYVDTNNETMS